MSRLDDELERAVRDGDADKSEGPLVSVAEANKAPPGPNRSIGLLIGLLVVGAAILTLVMTSFNSAAIYSKNVDQLLAQRDKLTSRNVRVAGTLVKGTLTRRDKPCEYRFQMQKNGKVLNVRYPGCVVPDTFRDVPGMNVAVTAEGKLTPAGYFEADRIMAKCPSKYDMNQRAQRGEKAPHPAFGTAAFPSDNSGT
jgi:cytochrome c-type biogenesis protein CcmE